MIIITKDGKRIAKFEKWDGNKAMDWITQKGLYRLEKVYATPDIIWVVKDLP